MGIAFVLGQIVQPGHLGYLAHKEQGGEDHPEGDGNDHVEDNGQRQADQQHQHVGFGSTTDQFNHLVRLTHVPGDDEQQRSHGRQWQPGEPGCQHQNGSEYHQRMNDPREG